MKRLLFSAATVLFSLFSFSQHQIHKRSGEVLEVKVIEIGSNDVSFLYPENEELVIRMDQDLIRKVVLEGGREITFTAPSKDPDYYVDQRKRAIKLNFLSPVTNYYIEALYEQSIRPGRSFEVGLGFIGAGEVPDRLTATNKRYYFTTADRYIYEPESARGIFIKGGFKLLHQPDHAWGNWRYSHIMKGGYIKPEVILGTYSVNVTTENWQLGTSDKQREGEMFGAFIINLGKQWIFDDLLLLDIYAGAGYGATTNNSSIGQYAMLTLDDDDGVGLALKGGMNIGILIK